MAYALTASSCDPLRALVLFYILNEFWMLWMYQTNATQNRKGARYENIGLEAMLDSGDTWIWAVILLFASKVLCHNPLLPGLPDHIRFTCLEPQSNQSQHKTSVIQLPLYDVITLLVKVWPSSSVISASFVSSKDLHIVVTFI